MKKILLLLLATVCSFSSYAQVDLQLGLQGFWELDNNGVDSLGLHSGTVVGHKPQLIGVGTQILHCHLLPMLQLL